MPLVVSRPAILVRAADPRWRELFERSDTVSKGAVRDEEGHGRMWYGSTSLILPASPGDDPGTLVALAARDLHVRLRALRAAHREACSRAPSRLGRVSCEMRFTADGSGVRIDVDVQAPLIEGRTRKAARSATAAGTCPVRPTKPPDP
ncbi:MAG: hypothetical protein JOZ69_11390 [Myxococcales bacterium]|nr:hypothetical protein [Myxococcales bacterium]